MRDSILIKLEAPADEVSGDGQQLRSLCQKEAQRFDEYLRATDPQFRDGLAKWELLAIEGYLYQKMKGHIDAYHEKGAHPVEGKNGTP